MEWKWALYGILRNVEFLKQRRILPKYVRKDQFESPKLWVFPSWKFLNQDDVGGGENWWRNYHGEDFSQSSLNTRPPPPRQFSHSTLSKVVAWGAAAAIIYRSRRHNWLVFKLLNLHTLNWGATSIDRDLGSEKTWKI